MAPNKTRKLTSLSRYANTLPGLYKWHIALFEKLGWIILAKEKGYASKVVEYKKSIGHLITSIKHVMDEYESRNRKHDLRVLLMHVEVLQEYAAKL
jgi:hypothetical protein